MSTPIEAIREGLVTVEPGACDVRRLGSGYEAEIFAYCVGGGRRVVRLFLNPADDARAEWESTVLDRLESVNYPVPGLHGFWPYAGSPWGRPFLLMDFVDGESLGPAFWGPPSENRDAARGTLFRLMARLHALDPDVVLGEAASPVPEQLARIQTYLGADVHDALRIALPAVGRKSVLHGDFHANNVLRGAAGCTAIDWSDACCGDPRFDVAWVRLLVRADEEPDRGQADLERYGLPLGELRPFEAFGAAKILAERFALNGGRTSPDDRQFESYLRRVLADRLGVDQAKLAPERTARAVFSIVRNRAQPSAIVSAPPA